MAQARVAGEQKYLGLFTSEEAACDAVAEFRDAHPAVRRRRLASVRRNHVRCFDEETLRPQRALILDVMQSGEKDLIALVTVTGRRLRCSVDHAVLTPEGWRKAGELEPGDMVMASGRQPMPQDVLVPPSLRRGIGVWTSMQRQRLIAETDRCYLCGGVYSRDELVLDHVIPVAADLSKALDVENLKPACLPCHRVKTNSEQSLARRGGSVSAAVPEEIVQVSPDGREMTYDLSVAGPWHNFLANGIVVHNSYNEESGRYRELQPVFYVPGPQRKLVQQGKPGQYVFVDGSVEQHDLVSSEVRDVCTRAYEAYQRLLSAGVAREVARMVLPVTIFSSMYVTLNARSMMSFLSLRTKREDSTFPSFPQREIEMVAERMEEEWARLMPLTHAAFDANGRVAP
ncbi:MAG: FAD-dependent thymidylate synthase [Actinomycetota bacterium]